MKKLYKRMKPMLGTFVEIAVSTDAEDAQEIVNGAFEETKSLQKLLSFQDPNSEITKLNSSSGEFVSLHEQTIKVIELALEVQKKSNGLFNCTVGGKLVNRGRLPNHGWKNFLDSGNESDIEISETNIRFKRQILVTLDGIAKGFAVDQAIEYLKSKGFTDGWINAGGDLRIFGDVELPVSIRDPGKALKLLGVFSNVAIATSQINSDFESEYPGTIVSSEINQPQPGIWSIAAPNAWLADALTKVAAQVEQSHRRSVIEQLGGRLLN